MTATEKVGGVDRPALGPAIGARAAALVLRPARFKMWADGARGPDYAGWNDPFAGTNARKCGADRCRLRTSAPDQFGGYGPNARVIRWFS